MKKFNLKRFYFDNTLDAFVPELWAQEGLAILEENMVLGNLVHRDFSELLANWGDTVNTRKPGEFKAKRKSNSDTVSPQDANATNIPVVLDQHIYVSFMIMDGEESKSFQELTQIYLRPGALAMARIVDQILAGQAIRFRKYRSGGLNTMTDQNAGSYIIDTRTQLNTNKVIEDMDRQLVIGTIAEGIMLKDPAFTEAYRVGDDGTALREASLGRKYGFNIFMAQNMPYVPHGNTTVTGAVDNVSGYVAGTSTFTVDGLSAAIAVGTWFTIAGDDTPLQVVSTSGGSTPVSIVTYYPTIAPVLNDAVITLYTPGSVNNSSGYPAGYDKEITVNNFSVAPVIGQPVTFSGNNANVYTIIDVNGLIGITVDRPLVLGVSNTDKVCIGPAGSYNFGFHRNAIAFVNRPLALPRPGMGALASSISFNNLSMRVVMTYQGKDQGTLVTLDMLAGVAQLEPLDGVLFLA